MAFETTWLVVSDSEFARFFLVENLREAEEISTLSVQDFADEIKDFSDKPGREFERIGPARSAMERKTSHKEKIILVFAKHLSEVLLKALQNGEFTKLFISAPPDFLGTLRSKLDENVKKTIKKELAKNLMHLPPQEIMKHFHEK